ncbi:MAG: polyprenol monophosphomannose synthase, partial [Nocardioidaceae bacterium]
MTSARTLVVIPTYNEAENIELVLERVHASVPDCEVLVVDDASPDGTGDLAAKVATREEWAHVLHRDSKEGLGAAYLAGFAWGLDRAYDVLCEMDADGSHLPEQLPYLLDALVGADVVLGSRWVQGGRVVNWPRHRKLLSLGGNTYARLALGLPLRDSTGGFRVYRREALEGLDLST